MAQAASIEDGRRSYSSFCNSWSLGVGGPAGADSPSPSPGAGITMPPSIIMTSPSPENSMISICAGAASGAHASTKAHKKKLFCLIAKPRRDRGALESRSTREVDEF
ncbi:MAG: hypothetical protein IPK67_01435 [Planctomycetes bacterium]|nr:hypothetical protein [Planctomycetota bacterium]